jgi:hypothetical protein
MRLDLTGPILRALVPCFVISALAGCGGGDKGPKNSTKPAIAACLNAHTSPSEVTVIQDVTSIKDTPFQHPENVVYVRFGQPRENGIFIDPESDKDSADAAERDMKDPSTRAAKVERKGNVVVGWLKEPTSKESDSVGACV